MTRRFLGVGGGVLCAEITPFLAQFSPLGDTGRRMMTSLSTPRIFVAGSDSGVGKSLLVTGLVVALKRRRVSVACCVVGDALQQAAVLHRLARRYTRVLDRRLLTPAQVQAAVAQSGVGADLILIDGQRGLLDGEDSLSGEGSDGALAALTATPVVLVADLPKFSASACALAKGFQVLLPEAGVAALIGTRFHQREQGPGIDVAAATPAAALQRYNQMAALRGAPPMHGWLPEIEFATQLPARGSSQRRNETVLPMAFLTELARLVEAHVDIDRLLAVARAAATLELDESFPAPCPRRGRIAVTDDPCFSVGYQDNLALLQHFGAELVSFSPLLEGKLPNRIGGVYLSGAFLHEYGEELARNEPMRDALRQFAEAGGVVYSEGAGTAYLCRSFQLERGGTRFPGVGLIPLDAVCAAEPPHVVDATISEDSILGPVGTVVRGVDAGEWRLESPPDGVSSHLLLTLHVEQRGHTPEQSGHPQLEGYSSFGQQCSTFHLLHFGSAPEVARSLVDAAAVVRR